MFICFRFDKQEKNVLNVFKTADKAEEDLDTILQVRLLRNITLLLIP